MIQVAILLICIPLTHGSGIEISQLNASAGIYFEEIGRANLYANEWKIITFYDLADFKSEFKNIQYITEQVTAICRKLGNNSAMTNICNGTLLQINLIIANIEYKNMLLTTQNRKQRSLFNAIGIISKSLFGTLNEDDAKLYDEQIRNLTQNQNTILSLMKSQTLIVEATANIFNKTKATIEKEFLIMHKKLTSIQIATTTLENRTIDNKISIELESLISLVTLMAYRYQNTQNEIVDLLTDSRHGKFHPTLISPGKIEKLLLNIRQELPNSMMLPINSRENIVTQIYKLSTIAANIFNNKIILELRFPLPFQEPYQIFKAIALPTLLNGSFIYIKPSNDYLLINYNREHYVELTLQDIHNCATLDQTHFYCRISTPILNTNDNKNQCEINLIKKEPITSECKILPLQQTSYWKQLSQQNAWLFSLKEPLQIDIICEDTINSQILHNTGKIYIYPGCYVRSKEFILHGHNIKTSKMNSHFIPTINISDIIANITVFTKVIQKQGESNSINIANNEELEKLLKSIQHQKNQESIPLNPINNHHIHHYTITYITLAIVISMLCVYLYIKYKTKIRKSGEISSQQSLEDLPRPAPRKIDFKITPAPSKKIQKDGDETTQRPKDKPRNEAESNNL